MFRQSVSVILGGRPPGCKMGPKSQALFRVKINIIFYLIKEFMKHSCINFFYEIVGLNKISIKVKRNWNLKNLPRLKDD